MARRQLAVFFCRELIPYRQALAWQRQIQARAFGENPPNFDVLLLLQHESIFTLGRRSVLENLRFNLDDQEHDIIRVERGGEVTWHGPGQLVGYPILNLVHHKKDLHWFLRSIEQVIIDTLKDYKLTGERDDAGTGVWVDKSKVAAIGLSASKWVSMHGFSINVNPDLESFERIVPCGIEGRNVTSLDRLLNRDDNITSSDYLCIDDVARIIGSRFASQFDFELEWQDHAVVPPDIVASGESETSFSIVRERRL